MTDVKTIVGDPISAGENTTIIPVSKVSFGFASGGSDLPSKQQNELFGGGGGAGITISPIAFLVVTGSNVKILNISESNNTADKVVNMIPEMFDKVSGLVKDGKKKKEEA
jgi:sporulation protein YtfJ